MEKGKRGKREEGKRGKGEKGKRGHGEKGTKFSKGFERGNEQG